MSHASLALPFSFFFLHQVMCQLLAAKQLSLGPDSPYNSLNGNLKIQRSLCNGGKEALFGYPLTP